MAIRSISCFAGCGGLDLAVELTLAGVEPVVYLENEIATAEILVARIKEGSLPKAHVWSDITTFDAAQLRGKIDLVYGGFPCPDYSVAGKRAGIVGKHGQLWNSMRRIIREVSAGWVFLENVPGILYSHPVTKWRAERNLFGDTVWTRYRMPAGLAFVLADLAEMGFDAEWGCIPASAVGASHKRDRWFCLAYHPQRGCGELRESSRRGGFADKSRDVEHAERAERRPHAESGGCSEPREDGEGQAASGTGERSEPVGDATSEGREESRHDWERELSAEGGCGLHDRSGVTGGQLANAPDPRLEIGRRERGDDGSECPTAERSGGTVEERSIFAPGPASEDWQGVLLRRFWLRPSISQAETESTLRHVADGLADLVVHERADALRAIGNGVVAVQGAAMLRELLKRALMRE